MTNRPRRVASLAGYGIEIVEQIPIASSENARVRFAGY